MKRINSKTDMNNEDMKLNDNILLTELDRVFESSDMYIGQSVHGSPIQTDRFVFNPSTKAMEFKNDVCYPLGLLKLFDECIVNVADNIQRGYGTNKICIELDKHKGIIKVYNNGRNFPISLTSHNSSANPCEKAYTSEILFFHLGSSTNYKKKQKITGGKNGLGIKIVNIFSKWFELEMCDGKLVYLQKSSNHMRHVETPIITKKKQKPYISLSFKPDISLFYDKDNIHGKQEGFEDELYNLLLTRVYDIAGTTPKNISIYLTQKHISDEPEKIAIRTFKDYVNLFIPPNNQDSTKIGHFINDRWEVVLMKNPLPNKAFVSFVNNINTYLGGEHVKYIYSQVINFLRKKIPSIDKRRVQNSVFAFVRSTIEDPSFQSQSKATLSSSVKSFGSTCELPPKCLNVLLRNGVIDDLKEEIEFKNMKMLKKSTAIGSSLSNRISLKGNSSIEDAADAGKRGKKKGTMLFIVEGKSALQLMKAGFKVIGQKKFGALAIRGKIINSYTSTDEKVFNNSEVKMICQLLGLQFGVKADISKLRYENVCMLCDQDYDGEHIKALLIAFFSKYFPELLEDERGFLSTMVTPIVIAKPRTKKKDLELKMFFTLDKFETWLDDPDSQHSKYNIKYYKGLGTSDVAEGKQYFKNMNQLIKRFLPMRSQDKVALNMALSKDAKGRQNWMKIYDHHNVLDYMNFSHITYEDFIHKGLKHYADMAMSRGIPRIDGLTPSQRKCVHTFLKLNICEDVKVANIIGRISNHTNYHHGEDSLGKSVVGMSQKIVGKNNVNYFVPSGQFGSRADGGKVHAANRYIFTRLEKLTKYIFRKEDTFVLPKQFDEGNEIEPFLLAPIIPMILVNGSDKPAYAYKFTLNCYNPLDIINMIRIRLKNDITEPVSNEIFDNSVKPWYKNFKGKITNSTSDGKFKSKGVITKVNSLLYKVTELPIQCWSVSNYRKNLVKMMESGKIKDFDDGEEGEENINTDSKATKRKRKKKNKKNDVSSPMIIDDDDDTDINNTFDFKDDNDGKSTNDVMDLEIDIHLNKPLTMEKVHRDQEGTIIETETVEMTGDTLLEYFKLIDNHTSNLFMFSETKRGSNQFNIRQFQSVSEIFEEYYQFRYFTYEQRRVGMIANLKKEIPFLTAKQEFIRLIVNNEIKKGLKKQEMETCMIQMGLKKIYHEKLLAMKLNSLTKERIDSIENDLKTCTKQIQSLESITVSELWQTELDELENVLKN